MSKKLRSYKGVTYKNGEFVYCGWRCESASTLIHLHNLGHFSDDDHAALMDLKANPYEPEPRLEEVVAAWYEWSAAKISESDIRKLCDDLSSAFPHIDTPPEAPKELTADEHIEALVKMGWRTATLAQGQTLGSELRVIILPPESRD